ncbi:unnamed protein product [Ectocarpus sp. 8 AP-2014]
MPNQSLETKKRSATKKLKTSVRTNNDKNVSKKLTLQGRDSFLCNSAL